MEWLSVACAAVSESAASSFRVVVRSLWLEHATANALAGDIAEQFPDQVE